ncbi:hypothetical protein L3Y19_gp082 [Gordonia phage Neville]|uniref:Uncharacterized protein n=1 Tax=Gordonia phage Neville TaxID=2301693 RepID=A0A385DYE2_9CAUD|nr:hypothetical protein L3Y19_gp082 [Gordonia phage Neville]AXQ64451.1 hypothetical protein SEA_NEVILLE_82 [Gordonia phage Neville]
MMSEIVVDEPTLMKIRGEGGAGEPADLILDVVPSDRFALVGVWGRGPTRSYGAYMTLDKESAVILGERLIEFGSQP